MADLHSRIQRWLVNGIAITIPLVVTLLVLAIVLEFILGLLSPIVAGVGYFWANEPPAVVIQFTTLASIVGLFLVVGFVAEQTPGEHISGAFHRTMETIPGVSTLYTTVRRASDILVDDDSHQFQDVKLVEFPHRNAYMIGFVTAKPADVIADAIDAGEMVTIMVPLAPNPATNGFIMHVPIENVHDVDMTVEAAVGAIATLGVASDREGESD